MNIGGSKGAPGTPPWGPNSFNFMQFWGKIGQIIALRIHLWSWRPHLGEILDPPLMKKMVFCLQSFFPNRLTLPVRYETVEIHFI